MLDTSSYSEAALYLCITQPIFTIQIPYACFKLLFYLMQEAFEANSMAAEQRYMRNMHTETSKVKPDNHRGTDAQTDMQADQLCSVVFDVEQQQRMHILPRLVYAVSPDGQKATSFAFDRLDAVEAGDASCACCRSFTVCLLCLLQFLPHLACCVACCAACCACCG